MPDENRFSGIGDVMGDENGETKGDTAAETGSVTESTPAEASETSSGTGEEQAEREPDDGDAEDAAPLDTPAFAFEQTGAKSLYLRSSTVDTLDDTEFEVEAVLRREHDVRNLTGREFHDAAVRVLADHADEIAEHVVDAREE